MASLFMLCNALVAVINIHNMYPTYLNPYHRKDIRILRKTYVNICSLNIIYN